MDTLDLAEKEQKTIGFMNEENTARVERQKKAPITVIIGNPPYNVGQINENDNNKNRKYPVIDAPDQGYLRKDSKATQRTTSCTTPTSSSFAGPSTGLKGAMALSASSRITASSTRLRSTGCGNISRRISP